MSSVGLKNKIPTGDIGILVKLLCQLELCGAHNFFIFII